MAHPLAWRDLEMQDRLGEGHSGTVFSARLLNDVGGVPAGTTLAVKRYKPWVLDEPGQLERIFREVEVGRKVRHPSLVDVLGAVLDPRGQPALVMRSYEGPTLETVLSEQRRRGQVYPGEEALLILRGIAAGIVELHSHGVIHRDLKPANVILTGNGPVVADFGVVRSRDFVEQTTTGAFLGTVRYAAPEYLFGDEYDSKIDVYSFGAIAYEILLGRQHYAKYRHWARIVAAKLSGVSPLRGPELDKIAQHSDLRLARFAREVIDHSRCAVARRDLDLINCVHCGCRRPGMGYGSGCVGRVAHTDPA